MSYPNIKSDDFYRKINRKYKRYEIPKKKKTFKQICYPKEYILQPQQKFLAKYINPGTPYKGVLVFHRIGAGKTCTAVRIGETWKKVKKIIVVVPASLKGNFRDELRSPCAGNEYLTKSERDKMNKYHPSSDEYKHILDKSNRRIDKYYEIYSYNKFVELANEGVITLRNSVLIVDEIQNMVSEGGKYYKTLYETIHNAPANLRVVLLSATPMFDKPYEIALTMNLLRLPKELPTGKDFEKMFIRERTSRGKIYYSAKNMDIFKGRIKGYVSYYRGAPPHVFPETKIRFVKCEMEKFQYRSYLTVLNEEKKKPDRLKIISEKIKAFKKGDILNLPNNFFIGTRIISNIAFPNKDINEDGMESLKGRHLDLDNLKKYSTKFYTILTKIMRAPGPIFVYSNFKEYGGIRSFVKVLEHHGYKHYAEHGDGWKRFAVWSSDEKQDLRDEMKAVFNQSSNKNGSKLKIMIGSPSSKEGISFKNVRQIHIMEPYWNWSRMEQIIGRGVRYCSHKELDEFKRNVKVYIYIATHPDRLESIDMYINKLAQTKNKLIKQFDMALKESAIDCELFKNANVYRGEDDIVCE